MTGADLTRVFFVVFEIFLIKDPVLVTDEAVAAYIVLVESELELYILGYRIERTEKVGAKDLFSLSLTVNVVVDPVSVVGDGFHITVAVIPRSEAEDRNIHTLVLLLGNKILESLRR